MQEAEIEVSSDELQPHFERAYNEYRPKAEVKGFRKGKVPLEMIKKLFGESIEYKALDTVAGDLYHQVMVEREIQPVGRPSLVDMDFKRGQHFRFKIKYEVKPVIELKKYKGLKLERPIHKVTDAEIDAEILHLRRVNGTTAEVNAVTDLEHIVTADVQELDETGAPLIGKRTPNTRFYLSDETLAPEIKEALRTAERGGVYRATVESQHGDHTHATRIAITATKIDKVTLPAFDEALVRKITKEKVTRTEDFLKDLRGDIDRYWTEQADRKVADTIVADLIKEHTIPVPESLVNSFLDAFVEDLKSKSRDRTFPKDFEEKKFREESRSYAIWQAKWMLLKERIAEAEHITVSDEEITALAEAEAVRIGIPKDRVLEYYKSSASASERILSDKIMAFLKHHAVITDKVVAETPVV